MFFVLVLPLDVAPIAPAHAAAHRRAHAATHIAPVQTALATADVAPITAV